jgi:hypothetical protein
VQCSGDPWGAGDDEICRFDGNKQDVTVMVMGFETLPHNELDAAMEHLANVGKLFLFILFCTALKRPSLEILSPFFLAYQLSL